jgi:hypothetical protein
MATFVKLIAGLALMMLALRQYVVSILVSPIGKAEVTAGTHDSTHTAGNGQILISDGASFEQRVAADHVLGSLKKGSKVEKRAAGPEQLPIVKMPGASFEQRGAADKVLGSLKKGSKVEKRAAGPEQLPMVKIPGASFEQRVAADKVLGSLKKGDEIKNRAAGPEQRFRRMPSAFSTCVPEEVGVTKGERDAVKYWLNLDVVARKKDSFLDEVRTNGIDGSSLDYIKIPTRLRADKNNNGDGKECVDHYHYMPGGDQDPRVQRFRDYLRKRQRVSCTDPPSTAERDACNLVDFVQVQESHNSPGSRTTMLLGVWASYLHNGTLLCFRLTFYASSYFCLSF